MTQKMGYKAKKHSKNAKLFQTPFWLFGSHFGLSQATLDFQKPFGPFGSRLGLFETSNLRCHETTTFVLS